MRFIVCMYHTYCFCGVFLSTTACRAAQTHGKPLRPWRFVGPQAAHGAVPPTAGNEDLLTTPRAEMYTV